MFWSQIGQVFGSSKVAKFGNFELLAGKVVATFENIEVCQNWQP